jgi:ParB family chromosome partitioning protein
MPQQIKEFGGSLNAVFGKEGTDNKNSQQDLSLISVNLIKPSKHQSRTEFNIEELKNLALSIKEQGVLQPIIVKPANGKFFELIAGERRWRAAKLAEIIEIPAIIKKVSEETATIQGLIENLQRQDLNPLEEALGYQKLIDKFAFTHNKVAEKVGKSRTTVTNMLRLLSLEETVKEFIKNSHLEMGHARALLSLLGREQINAAQRVVNKKLSVRETENLVQKLKNPYVKPDEPETELITMANDLSQRLSQSISSEVKICVNNKGEGRVVINFSSLDEVRWLADKIESQN